MKDCVVSQAFLKEYIIKFTYTPRLKNITINIF